VILMTIKMHNGRNDGKRTNFFTIHHINLSIVRDA
jgi:hypothetical protein